MEHHRWSVQELFEPQRRYVVPLFQRPYVWKREEQWEPLWADILGKVVDTIAHPSPNPHFLGSIVVTRPPDTPFGDVQSYEIVDGQQRLTTLQICLVAIHDVARQNASAHADAFRRLTWNPDPVPSDDQRFKVWPCRADQAALRVAATAGSPQTIQSSLAAAAADGNLSPSHPLLQAYSFFFEQAQNFLAQNSTTQITLPDKPDKRLHRLLWVFQHCLDLVVIQLSHDRDDPQIVFESLNGYSAPLHPSDLVRNFILRIAAKDPQKQTEIYKRWWAHYDELPAENRSSVKDHRFWLRTEQVGRLERARLDIFLQHYLAMQLAREVNVRRLYQEFRTYWTQSNITDVEGELQSIRRHSDMFRSLLLPDLHTRTGLLADRLKALETTTLYPILLFLLVSARNRVPDADVDGILADLESYIVRRLVCGRSAKEYNQFFASLLGTLRHESRITRTSMQMLLDKSDAESARWPDDREFKEAWLSGNAYKFKQSRLRMILGAIEMELRKDPRAESKEVPTRLEIEHFMPQDWRTNWPIDTKEPPSSTPEADAEARDQLVQTIGNLTLLTRRLNGQLSNSAFSKKKELVLAYGGVLLLSRDFLAADKWTEKSILSRGEKLFGLARTIWPHPSSPSAT